MFELDHFNFSIPTLTRTAELVSELTRMYGYVVALSWTWAPRHGTKDLPCTWKAGNAAPSLLVLNQALHWPLSAVLPAQINATLQAVRRCSLLHGARVLYLTGTVVDETKLEGHNRWITNAKVSAVNAQISATFSGSPVAVLDANAASRLAVQSGCPRAAYVGGQDDGIHFRAHQCTVYPALVEQLILAYSLRGDSLEAERRSRAGLRC